MHGTGDRPPSRPLRVLVAEDSPVNQRLVQAVLEAAGHAAVLAASGREALAALEREPFDLVLMDAQMPDMDGFQATAAIRAREQATGARLPIVAMTAQSDAGDRERCLAAGMDGYLAKPVRAAELIAQIERAAARDGGRPGSAEPAGRLARRELTRLFVADASQIAAEIRDAVERRDGGALERAAHRLRGSAGYFAAQATFELARRLEALGRDGAFTAETERASRELNAELALLERSLAAEAGE